MSPWQGSVVTSSSIHSQPTSTRLDHLMMRMVMMVMVVVIMMVRIVGVVIVIVMMKCGLFTS